jgi:biopolymer transport protein ExbD
MATLEQRLAEFKSANPDLPVVLKGDAAAHYATVSEVLEICKKLDITEVGLVTKKAAE